MNTDCSFDQCTFPFCLSVSFSIRKRAFKCSLILIFSVSQRYLYMLLFVLSKEPDAYMSAFDCHLLSSLQSRSSLPWSELFKHEHSIPSVKIKISKHLARSQSFPRLLFVVSLPLQFTFFSFLLWCDSQISEKELESYLVVWCCGLVA